MAQLQEACPLTGQAALVEDGVFDGWTVDGPYTAGAYRISRSVIGTVRALAPVQKSKLITWLIDRRRFGEGQPLIASHVIEEVQLRRPLSYDQKIERYFLMLRSMEYQLGIPLRYAGILDDDVIKLTGFTRAWMEISTEPEIHQFLGALVDEALLREQNQRFYLTASGLRRLDSLSQTGAESDQAFVAMWFSEEMDDAYTNGFAPAIEALGHRPLRIDKKEHNNKIDDEIIAEIRRSRFVVADFTCEVIGFEQRRTSVPRGGVYYEAGFAQGLGVPVIWSVRDDCIDYVHFDTRQFSHIVWSDPDDLRVRLTNRIGAVIGSPTRK